MLTLKICSRCSESKELGDFPRNRTYCKRCHSKQVMAKVQTDPASRELKREADRRLHAKRMAADPEGTLAAIAEQTKMSCRKLRQRVIIHLGSKCCRCGFSDWRALQVDHVNGGGTQERNRIQSMGIYRKVLKDSTGYQLLCANCNWIKRYEEGEHR